LHSRRRHNREAKKSEREPIRHARSYFWTFRCSGGRTCISGSTQRDASGLLPPMQCKAEHSSRPDNVRMLPMQTSHPRRGRYGTAASTPQAARITSPANAAFAPVPESAQGRSSPLGVGAVKGTLGGVSRMIIRAVGQLLVAPAPKRFQQMMAQSMGGT
jgi:hypothetical protein